MCALDCSLSVQWWEGERGEWEGRGRCMEERDRGEDQEGEERDGREGKKRGRME